MTERITRVSHDEQMLEYACHEGNYSLGYALMGARATDNATVAKQ